MHAQFTGPFILAILNSNQGLQSQSIGKTKKITVWIITRRKYNAHRQTLFNKLNVLKLNDHFDLNVLRLHYKFRKNILIYYISYTFFMFVCRIITDVKTTKHSRGTIFCIRVYLSDIINKPDSNSLGSILLIPHIGYVVLVLGSRHIAF